MLKHILHLQDALKKRAAHVPKAYKLVFKAGALEAMMRIKGWRNNAAMARETGYTRQYISMVRRGVVSVTVDFLLRILDLTGNINSTSWSELFEIIPRGDYNPNAMMWNADKLNGIRPYSAGSGSAEFRSKDHDVETDR